MGWAQGKRDEVGVRERGYYWVKFPYHVHSMNIPEHWEIGSWDPDVSMWMLIGGNDPWYDFQLQEIGKKIEEPT